MKQSPLLLEPLRFICRNMREASRKEVFATHDIPPDILAEVLFNDFSDVAWIGSLDEPIYAGGAYPIGDGVWQTWGFATDRFKEIATPITKFVRRVMMPTLKERGCTRVESTCSGEDPHVAGWMKVLGYEQVRIVPAFGRNGEDFILYQRAP